MDRKTFLRNLVAAGTVLPCCTSSSNAESGKCEDAQCTSDAKAVREFVSTFVRKEEGSLSGDATVKLMEERGRACCRALDFRQKLILDSQGSLDKLVELMGKIVGPENCRREGNLVTLVHPPANAAAAGVRNGRRR